MEIKITEDTYILRMVKEADDLDIKIKDASFAVTKIKDNEVGMDLSNQLLHMTNYLHCLDTRIRKAIIRELNKENHD